MAKWRFVYDSWPLNRTYERDHEHEVPGAWYHGPAGICSAYTLARRDLDTRTAMYERRPDLDGPMMEPQASIWCRDRA